MGAIIMNFGLSVKAFENCHWKSDYNLTNEHSKYIAYRAAKCVKHSTQI